MDAETRDLLALRLVQGLGPRLTKALVERFGSAAGVLTASSHELRTVRHIGDKAATDLAAALKTVSIEKELELLEKHQVHLVRLSSPHYPQSLANTVDPPQLLYVRGTLAEADKNAIAIVGSRHCTNYGRRIAERLAGDLVRAGYTVVSGLARGIDGMAHRGALAAGGRTLAIMACGLSRIYPPEHSELAEEVACSGALLSESPMGAPPMAEMFPARNRLISGLSRGVVVVEAAEKSGALITARHAGEQGREVFAVPGPVDSPASSGTLWLLRNGATLVRNVDDILEEFGQPSRATGAAVQQAAPALPEATVVVTEKQQKVLDGLANEPIHADQLVQRSGLSVSEVGSALMMMEMRGLIRRLPGNRFERK